MFSKSTKRLSVFLSAALLSVFLTGISAKKAEALIPRYILIPLTIQATGYAVPRVYKRLTPQQRKQVDAIRDEAFTQIGNVFTKAQRSQVMQSLKTKEGRTKIIQSMKLTPQQKTRIQSIVKTSRQRINAIVGE
ncbi:MAG: hypothetical protein HC836_01425 [Richelia sp. RM2_1_2]|nr:hypothetical protein [Richelia sp. SM2_1_7]NJM18615.1 hypothetical protein [Richelia sp. SM1_7_0]NJN07934.1 hypothetical protein [Richelia sp. RM1_1_1]NJO26701.1 hypothetical protein [Richelia sp. SL_2_1]NJO57077.1 hypothetical protein [Richelia sp. RM2_1_2]